ncbi:hypothetical protein B0H13DRAFT_1908400 [Mycena leptocephala]|nr:hypothetical protein B0H13DRAFT_1908400 [Mycena leptocephala]
MFFAIPATLLLAASSTFAFGAELEGHVARSKYALNYFASGFCSYSSTGTRYCGTNITDEALIAAEAHFATNKVVHESDHDTLVPLATPRFRAELARREVYDEFDVFAQWVQA